MSILDRFLPENVFPRRVPSAVDQRLRLSVARAEEALIRTHVANALRVVDALAPEVPFERALDTYVRELAVPEPMASIVVTRALVVLGDGLVPEREGTFGLHDGRAPNADEVAELFPRPRLWIGVEG